MSVIRDLLDSTKLLLNDSLATTGSNIFVGTQTLSGSIIPAADNIYDLGSPTKQWRDLYLSSASLYIDGTKVISSNTDTLTFTTDAGQSIKLLETGGDDITLQTDTGNIELKGTVEIESGKKITDSAATMINFGDSIAVTGSILTTGTVDGIDLQAFSSSVAAGFANTTADYNELTNIPAGIISSSAQIASDISGSTNWTSVSSSILPSDTEVFDLGSTSKRWRDLYLSGSTIDLGGTKISRDSTTGDIEFKDGEGNRKSIKIDELTIGTGATAKKLKVNNGKVQFTDKDDNVDGIDYTELSNIPAGIVSGSSQITTLLDGQDLTLNNLTVDGTQTIIDSTRLAIGDNIIELNAGGATNGGLLIKDVTAPNNVSGSLLWDSTNDYWIGGALGSEERIVLNGDTPSLGGLTTTGNVGIGTSSPGYKLDIASNTINQKLFRLSHPTAPTEAGFMIGFNTDGTVDDNVISLGVEYSTVDYDVINIQRSTRNIGIGTTNPLGVGARTTVNLQGTSGSAIRLSDDISNSFLDYTDTEGCRLAVNAAEPLKLFTNSTERMRIDSSGDILLQNSTSRLKGGGSDSGRMITANYGVNSYMTLYGSTYPTTSLAYATQFINNSGVTATFTSGNKVGIGTASPETKLHLTGAITISDVGAADNTTLIQFTESTNYDQFAIKGDFNGTGGENKLKFTTDLGGGDILTMKGDGNVGIGTTSPSTKLQVAGTVTATALTETSALRFKENIQEDIDSSIIDKLRPVSYDWKENKEKDYGFIAEEVNELDSTLTTENEDGEMLGIKYTKLIPFLVKKIQEQEERIKQLENGNS